MNSPIPEPGAYDATLSPNPAVTRGPRPVALNIVILLRLAAVAIYFSLGNFSKIDALSHTSAPNAESIAVIAFIAKAGVFISIAVKLVLTFFLWRGADWARILVIALAAFSLTGVFTVFMLSGRDRLLSITTLLISAVTIYLLLRPPVVAFTQGKAAPSS